MSTEILTGPTGAGGLDPPRLAATSFKDSARKVGRPIVFGLLVLAAWELAVDIYGIRPTLLPPPSQIFREMLRNREILLLNAVPTTVETVAGSSCRLFSVDCSAFCSATRASHAKHSILT